MNQGVTQQNFMALLKAIKLHETMGQEKNVRLVLQALRPRPRVRICLPLGQSHFSHGFHTDLGQSLALYEFDSPQKFSNTTLYYFSMVKIPLGLVTLRSATVFSRLNT